MLKLFHVKQFGIKDCPVEIVSRETISTGAKANEAISNSATDDRLLLLQIGLTPILAGFSFIELFDHCFWTL